jgi:1-acyl-sn-glycerol-3-phosphate acyltransferase
VGPTFLKFARRSITLPGYLLAWAICFATLPLWCPLLAIVDAARGSRGVALRCATLLAVYLSCEVLGIAASAGLWIWKRVVRVDEASWLDAHFRLEMWWGTALFDAVIRLFGIRLDVRDDADLGRGPYLLLVRHASTADTLLACALASRSHGIRLRYVLKRELLWDPCIDICGNRLPNVFVDRFSGEPAREVARVRELARDLGPCDGLLIYPEGTRFSPEKRQRILARLEREGDLEALAYARSLECVLPPRRGGILGLLEAVPQADVVVCAHTGLEGTASLGQIWNGALLDCRLQVEFRRIARREVPTAGDGGLAWLLEEWRRVDAWVRERQQPGRDPGVA